MANRIHKRLGEWAVEKEAVLGRAGVEWALDAALTLWKDPASWKQLQQNGMAEDFSWHRQVEHYLELYRQLLGG